MPGQDANEHTSGIETGPLERAAPGYLQAVERCLALLVPAKRRWDEAPWPALDGQQYKKYLKSYYVATIENLDQLGLTKVITPEEIRQLCVFKLLLSNRSKLGSTSFCLSAAWIETPDNRSVRGGKVTNTVRDQRPENAGRN